MTEIGGQKSDGRCHPGEISCAVTSSISLGKEDGRTDDRDRRSEIRDQKGKKKVRVTWQWLPVEQE